MDFSSAPVTFSLIAINVIISLIGFSNAAFVDKAVMWPYRIKREKEYYRFITSGFIHADLVHLFFNMFSFYFFGRAIESYFSEFGLGGNISYLLLYFLGVIIADIPSYLKNQDNYNYRALGASGAVSAVIFACILFNPWGIILIYFIPMPFIIFAFLYLGYCIYMSKRNIGHVNHDAHLWGSLFGLIFTVVLIASLAPQMFPAIMEELSHPHFGR
ncbi:MAG: rhomboid family intramembrane serine protease [Ferruginibacter sp.]|nr:rhomboid family intramembrane serine protease [Ferruginibacter sp.]